MKTIKTKETKEKDWTRPGVKLTYDEFMAGIKKAEEGPFYTFKEIKVLRTQWRSILHSHSSITKIRSARSIQR